MVRIEGATPVKWQNQVVFPLLIINASGTFTGLFVYSPSIGTGNLVDSITAQSGTDPYGNAYLANIAAYGPTSAAQLTGALLRFHNTSTPGNVDPNIQGTGGAGGQSLFLSSGKGTVAAVQASLQIEDSLLDPAGVGALLVTGRVLVNQAVPGGAMLVVTEQANAPTAPPVQFQGNQAGDRVLGIQVTTDAANFRLRIDSNGRMDWGPGNAAVDTNLERISSGVLGTTSSWQPATMAAIVTASLNNFTAESVIGTYTIPANDPAAGSSYTFWGVGVAGDVLTPTLQLRIRVGGLTGALIGNTGVMTCRTAAGMAFSWNGRLAFRTVGASSTIDADTQINEEIIATTGGGHPFATSGATGPATTSAITVVVTAAWGTASGSNTVQTNSGTMERIQH